MRTLSATLALLSLAAPAAARAGDLYTYTDGEGVVHFTNVPSDGRYRKVTRTSDADAGVYKVTIHGRRAPTAARLPSRNADYEAHIEAAALKYKLPVALLKAVMAVESNFNRRAVSEKGAQGLMQLMPQTAKEMYVDDAYDPAQNIEGGARYLRILANQFDGDMLKTVAAYNAGPDAVVKAGGRVPNIPETREYVRRVFALYHDYKNGL